MGDPNLEFEKIAKLQAFRDEIKRIKEIDDTLREVVDVNKLEPEESVLWEEWKAFFSLLDNLFVDFEISNFKDKKTELEDVLLELKKLIKNLSKQAPSEHDKSQKEFVFWMRNRAGGIIVPLESFQECGEEEDLYLIRQFIVEEKPKVSF